MLLRHFLLILLLFAVPLLLPAQERIWQGTGNKSKATVTPYLAAGGRTTAVIVCPGGSYFWLDHATEGRGVAEWLQQQGLSAFVLDYRVAGVFAFLSHYRLLFRGHRYPDAIDDLRQALRYVRAHAEEYGVDPDSIGVIGFSAGGHLVLSSGVFLAEEERPSFIGAIYPVVSMSASCTHKRSRRALLGDSRKRNKALRDSLSIERCALSSCPPVFVVNCKDDPVVDYRNSELLDSALTAAEVPHTYLQYATGGHGFGASDTKGSAESRTWRQAFLAWLRSIGYYQ